METWRIQNFDPIVKVSANTSLKIAYIRGRDEVSRLRFSTFDLAHGVWMTFWYNYTDHPNPVTILQVVPIVDVMYRLEAWNVWGPNEWPMPGIRTD
jgi:hypothetical protein